MKLQAGFKDSWQEDLYSSFLRFLPEPPPDPENLSDPLVYRNKGEYWAVIWVQRGRHLNKLKRNPLSVPLWVSEKDHHCYAFPSILLDDV